MTSEVQRTQASPVPPPPGTETGQAVADAAVQAWRAVDAALAPIIGQRGVAALYERSLYLVRDQHPWLVVAHEHARQPDDFTSLHVALARQSAPAAAAAHEALLQTYRDILAQLLGAPLTERLLRSVEPLPPSRPDGQDTSP